MELTDADAGAQRSVGVGQDVVVRLPENRTTGYRWSFDLPEEGLELADDSYTPPDPGRPGAGGIRTVRLRVTRVGTHRVGAALRRSWESGGAGRRVEFTLHAG